MKFKIFFMSFFLISLILLSINLALCIEKQVGASVQVVDGENNSNISSGFESLSESPEGDLSSMKTSQWQETTFFNRILNRDSIEWKGGELISSKLWNINVIFILSIIAILLIIFFFLLSIKKKKNRRKRKTAKKKIHKKEKK